MAQGALPLQDDILHAEVSHHPDHVDDRAGQAEDAEIGGGQQPRQDDLTGQNHETCPRVLGEQPADAPNDGAAQ